MNFVERVIADLEAFRFTVAFPALNPICKAFGSSMLFELGYNENYNNAWAVSFGYDAILGVFEQVELTRGSYKIKLTKLERRALINAYKPAIEKAYKDWEQRCEDARK